MASANDLSKTPKQNGYRQPAEWDLHDSVWLAWPTHEELWQENLPAAQEEFTALCRAIADVKDGKVHGESLNILVPTAKAEEDAQKALVGLPVNFHPIPFGDVWLRDTAPIFLKSQDGVLANVRFQFNGWGEKYLLPHDNEVAANIAKTKAAPSFSSSLILEGGSIEVDGEGTCLTTRQCLLNANRNPGWTQDKIENELMEMFGVEKVLWLGDGLINDHTDGHIDTIARFVAPGVVVCSRAVDASDPNAEIYEQIQKDLESMVDARGRKLKVVTVTSPGTILSDEGRLMPASYLNFYIANSTVVVPTYGSPQDELAVKEIAACFSNRRTIGLSAKAILTGGGAFHCISQQQVQAQEL